MKKVLLALVFLGGGLVLAADNAAEEAAKKDLEKMTGTWSVTYAEREGKELPKDELKNMKLIQKGEKWTFEGGDEVVEGVDKLDPSKNPKTSDSTITRGKDKGKTVLGIYELDGDTWKSCWADPGKERPTKFATTPDSGQNYLIFKRAKP